MSKGLRFYTAVLSIAVVALWLFTAIQNSEFVELKRQQSELFKNETLDRESFDSQTSKRMNELQTEISFKEAEINLLRKKVDLLEGRIDDLVFEFPRYPTNQSTSN